MIHCFKLIILAEICIKLHYFFRNCKNCSALGASPLDLLASRPGWGLYPQQLEALLPDPQWPPAVGGSDPHSPMCIPSYATVRRI